MARRYTSEEVEARMIPQIVQAIYRVLIPVEQQDCRIQAENYKRMIEIATIIWRFGCADKRSQRMVLDALDIL